MKTVILFLILTAGLAPGQTAAGNFAGSGSSAAGYLGPVVGNWSLVQHQMFSTAGSTGSGSCAAGTATCTVNVSAIGAGHLLICLPHGTSVSGVNSCSGDGDSWNNECCLITGGNQTIDLWWVLSSNGGGTSVTCNFASTSTYKECGLREYSLSAGSPVSDSTNTGFCFTSPSCAGLGLSISGSNEIIIQSIFPSTSTSAITGTYGNLDVSTSGGGFADRLNTADGTAPSWTVGGSGTTPVNAISFKTSFGLLATRPPTTTGAGPRARAPARRPAPRAARSRRRRRNEREEKRDDRDERRDDRK